MVVHATHETYGWIGQFNLKQSFRLRVHVSIFYVLLLILWLTLYVNVVYVTFMLTKYYNKKS